jgi:hypothetical protein
MAVRVARPACDMDGLLPQVSTGTAILPLDSLRRRFLAALGRLKAATRYDG